nr:MAG TPA: hypothetical protein [Caudoviricetes sp.]
MLLCAISTVQRYEYFYNNRILYMFYSLHFVTLK